MVQTVYTNYWENRRDNVRKEHGSYATEEEAIEGIKAWWELHNEKYTNVKHERTNSGALEITYGDDNYYYRIEKREIDDKLPSRNYKLKSSGEIQAARWNENLHDEAFLFDELAEPYRDRLMVAMADVKKVRKYVYDKNGRPIKEL